MRQNHSRGGFDDKDCQNSTKTKSKIAKKSCKKDKQTREPLKATNKQSNPKKKNQEGKLYGCVIQKVDYTPRNNQENKTEVIDSQNKSPEIESEPNNLKSLSLKPCIKTNNSNEDNNYKKTKNQSNPDSNIDNNDFDEAHLQIINAKYSKFLQERINSHQNNELQPMPLEKNEKTVSFGQPIVVNSKKNNSKSDTNSKPKLRQSSVQSVERPEIDLEVETIPKKNSPCIQKKSIDNNNINKEQRKKDNIPTAPKNKVSKNMNVTPRKKNKSDFDSSSESDSEDDSINSFHSLEPKVPPKPIEHLVFEKKEKEMPRNSRKMRQNINTSKNEDQKDKQFKELIKRKNELDERINNAIQFQKQQEIEIENHFKTKSSDDIIGSATIDDEDAIINNSLIPRIEKIQNSLTSSSLSRTESSSKKTQSTKSSSSKSEIENISSSNILRNCYQFDPSSYVPKRRNFDMSGPDSDTDSENDLKSDLKSDALSEKKSTTQSPILLNKINRSKSEPRSPHVTWDISNCPPIRPKASNGFGINKSFSFINYDEINGYSEDKDLEQAEINHTEEIDFNSPTNFSKAIKLPRNLLNGLNPDFYNDEGNDNNFLYDNFGNEEEDTTENIPNYSRILSILNKMLDESQYNEVLNIMNNYKAKHFCLLISMPQQNIDSLYLLRSDLHHAKKLWGEGLSNVYKDDIKKYFSINIASKRFEQMKIDDFAHDVDAFMID